MGVLELNSLRHLISLFLSMPWLMAGQKLPAAELLNSGSLTLIDAQLNSSSWAAANIHDNDDATRWLSTQQANDLNFVFNAARDQACFSSMDFVNYGSDDRSVERFVLLRTMDAGLDGDGGEIGWMPVAADSAPADPLNYIIWAQGGRLQSTDSQLNTSSWASDNMYDGDYASRWLSNKGNNIHQFAFDTDWDGTTGDSINVEQIAIRNYGTDDRSVARFQVEVTLDGSTWRKLEVPGTQAGDDDFNPLLLWEGGSLSGIDGQLNSTSWAAQNIHDGDQNTRWLNNKGNNTLTFSIDTDFDGSTAELDADDRFDLQRIYLQNYGTDDRSIFQFQVEVKTASNPAWTKLEVPGSVAGESDFRFLLAQEGGSLTEIDGQLNSSSWAAANIHDGDQNTRWLNNRGNNYLSFVVDGNGDGNSGADGDASELFTLEKIYLRNYGADDRSVRQFQVEVKTDSLSDWTKLEVPGSAAGDAEYEYLLSHNGGALNNVDSQLNASSWAAANIHDGDQNTRWLSNKQSNSLEFEFDTDLDGSSGDTVNIETLEFFNYGADDRSVATFEIDVLLGGTWTAVSAPGGGTVFTATMDNAGQSWSIGPFSSVAGLRFRSLTNHGDPNYTGARELIVKGTAVGPSYTFTAGMNGNGETFVLDPEDQVGNVTEVRLRTVNNHGDPSYTGAREFHVLGSSVHPNHTFEAAMNGNGEFFELDSEDRPSQVTAVRLITISNHGDPSYTGARSFRVFGPSTGPSHVFTAPMTSALSTIVLDTEDTASDVVGARFITVSNHGDPSYIGLREFGLRGTPVGPDYIFYPQMTSALQQFSFAPTEGTVFRFHPLSNHGDASYTGASEIKLYGNLGNCCSLGGLVISQPAAGIACPDSRAEIDIVAMCSGGVNVKADYLGTVQLSGPGGASFFDSQTGGSEISSYTFNPADNGAASVYLFYENVGNDVQVTVTDADAGIATTATAGTDFGAEGFRIYQQPENMLCGATTSVGIEAYGQVPGGNCQPLTGFTGDRAVKAWFEASLDTSSGADDTETPIGVPAGACNVAGTGGLCILDEGQPVEANLTLNFVAGRSSLILSHGNAARIDALHFRHDEGPYDGADFSILQAATNSFVVSPEQLQLSIAEADWSADSGAESSIFKKAGESFEVKVEAICADASTAVSYLSQADIALAHTLALPSGGSEGIFGTLSTRIDGSTVGGIQTVAQSISEVGVFDLQASLPNASYFGVTIAGAELENVGRFIPSYLEMVPNSPGFSAPDGCASPNTWNFAYQGQPFPWSIRPEIEITGKNIQDETTNNYDGAFFKFTNAQGGRLYVDNTATSSTLAFTSNPVSFRNDAAYDGKQTLEFNDNNFVYQKINLNPDSTDGLFHANVSLQLAIGELQDADGVCFRSDNSSECRGLNFENIGDVEIRYGRLRMENAFGPEDKDLQVPLRAEYWTSSGWETNQADQCTEYQSLDFELSNYQDALENGETDLQVAGSDIGNAGLADGEGNQAQLTAPGFGNPGSVDITLDVESWLEANWGSGAAEDPEATATFGVYRGHDRIIFWREVTD